MDFIKNVWKGTKKSYSKRRKFKRDVRQAAREAYQKEYKKRAIINAQRRASSTFKPRQLPLEQFAYGLPKPIKLKVKRRKHKRKKKRR